MKNMKKLFAIIMIVIAVLLTACITTNSMKRPVKPNEVQTPEENQTPTDIPEDKDPEEKPEETETPETEKPNEGTSQPEKPVQPNKPSNPVEEKPQEPQVPNPDTSSYPSEWEDNGLFKNYYTKAYSTLKTMSLDQKIEQMLLVRVPSSNATNIIQNHHFGGIVLFARDFKDLNKTQVIQKINNYQKGATIPLLTAVDEEGGKVVRISSNPLLRSTPYLSPQELFQLGGFQRIREDTVDKAKLLNQLGLNLLLGPVADVSTNNTDYIYSRTLGQDVNQTSTYIQTVVKTLKENNMSMSLKHFPGYGSNKDTHAGIAIDNRTLENFKLNDFLPFEVGIQAGAESIMVSHNIITNIENLPASLSPKIHKILREDLNFTGIIITDALDMGAITQYVKNDPIVQAVIAGNNLLIVTDYQQAYSSIKNGLNTKQIQESQIDEAVFKILAWKYNKGLLK